jgi:hypothetical protein
MHAQSCDSCVISMVFTMLLDRSGGCNVECVCVYIYIYIYIYI